MSLQLLVAQINATVGDVTGNAEKIKAAAQRALKHSASILLTPELSLVGYPPEDLVLRPAFLRRSQEVLEELVQASAQWPGLAVVVGHPRLHDGHVFNAATVFREGQVLGVYGKLELPNYAVFDEQRYFQADGAPLVFESKGIRFGVNICEDVWFPRGPAMAKAEGAQVLLVLNASPFHMNKELERLDVVHRHVNDRGLVAVMCNLVGGQDELIFDGDSFATNSSGEVVARANRFVEDDLLLTIGDDGLIAGADTAPAMSPDEQIYEALVMGTRDYVRKNGFQGGIIGLSGGIDSALTLAIAVDALGADQVTAVMMPSAYTAPMSLEDAKACAAALGVTLHDLPITPAFTALESTLAPLFKGLPVDTTEENLQSRIRGVLLMAISNKKGRLVLTTGNKSEMAVGYCTLYGDMAGGFAVMKDLLKRQVYSLSHMRNARGLAQGTGKVIPERILTRPPSAELRSDQTDQDSLPPYDQLDEVLQRFVEDGQSVADLLEAGFSRELLSQVIRLVRSNEYKRRQAAPGPRISKRAFGRDWRFPITNRFTEKEFFQ